MTLEQFLDELSNLPELIRSNVAAYIIFGQIGCKCPIAAVFGYKFNLPTTNADYILYAKELGLSPSDCLNIAMTADSGSINTLRESMLEKLGVK